MKGQQDVLSTILISGILIAVVGSVYFWGVPLIEKNQDISILQNSEDFMNSLNSKIKFIANNGGKDQLRITIPGTLEISGEEIQMTVDTKGTIYAAEAEIPLGRNECPRVDGVWGLHESHVFCVKSNKIDDTKITTTYSLKYIELDAPDSGKKYKIEATGESIGSTERTVVIENLGIFEESGITKTRLRLDIV
ncbi:hypothetical protein ACFLQN_00020 [Candidatus Aenigmatarchaeota archaeon]